jgi:hypothetical protein
VSRTTDPMIRGRQLADDGHVRIIARDPRHVRATVRSSSDPDRNLVPANIVDAIADLARSIHALAAALDEGSDR